MTITLDDKHFVNFERKSEYIVIQAIYPFVNNLGKTLSKTSIR